MPLTPGNVHIDKPLSNLFLKDFESGASNIADTLFPVLNVPKQSDVYYIGQQGDWLREALDDRGPGAPSKRIEWSVASDTYFAKGYGLAEEYPLETIANADQQIQFRQNTTLHLAEALARLRERRIARLVMSGGNVGSGATLSGPAQWTDYTNSDPIGDVNTAHAYAEDNGIAPFNTLVTTDRVMRVLVRHPDLLEMYKYTNAGQLSDGQIADLFRVDRILIGKGVINTGTEGGTDSIGRIWDDNVLLAHIEPVRGLRTNTLGLQMRWTSPELGSPMAIQRKRNDDAGSNHTEVIEARYYQDEKIISTRNGYVIQDPIP